MTTLCFTFLAAQPRQKGKASYYSKSITGSLTSSGERLHHDSMTCAHRTYPFGTRLKVTNPTNDRVVIVRVTDRGPYRRGRIIDLSWGAAKALGILSQGVAVVMVEPMDTTIVPFRPSTGMDMPEFDFGGFEHFDGIRPEWQEMKEINHKTPRATPKKAVTGRQARPAGTPATVKKPAGAPKNAVKPADERKGSVIDEINSKPNTSRAYSKRQGGGK